MKKFEDLNCIDNFMFNELIMQKDREKAKRFCKTILERVLGIKIRIIDIAPQRMVQGMIVNNHGIQMDAWITAIEGDTADISVNVKPKYYDIEPNLYRVKSEPKRIRYYHSIIDAKIFEAGEEYEELPSVIMIVISDYDMFGKNSMMYTIKNSCVEFPEMDYDDGRKTIVLYTDGKPNLTNKEDGRKLSDMLQFLKDSSKENVKDEELSDIKSMVDEIKHDSNIGVTYMHTYDMFLHYRREGLEEGLKEGRKEGLKEGRKEGLEEGLKEGRIEILVETILDNLKELGDVSPGIQQEISDIKDENRLKELNKLLGKCSCVDDFIVLLNKGNTNETTLKK